MTAPTFFTDDVATVRYTTMRDSTVETDVGLESAGTYLRPEQLMESVRVLAHEAGQVVKGLA